MKRLHLILSYLCLLVASSWYLVELPLIIYIVWGLSPRVAKRYKGINQSIETIKSIKWRNHICRKNLSALHRHKSAPLCATLPRSAHRALLVFVWRWPVASWQWHKGSNCVDFCVHAAMDNSAIGEVDGDGRSALVEGGDANRPPSPSTPMM